ncbi:16S rRNA (uracil(1498)-N(3))-methyltransferase [Microbulbifer flavimaris]|uniref:Ribosomal RNA small subunit methyltransferase E n=1 Tax=Microbulbifer flavimaris TaxID=1781068 RepID=A0ABX4I344_9GAMM|nr:MULTISPECIES: 16S rRNA (uracil(1498)-N(3))-methyltransferase [Microbulbifer]KUJ83755.1 16S rRNA methyltransferase [Microbulbifer sp. ZGT114]PCO05929.1 16S rRNA (uracil(1498)-N(3))-methyltransferase [Microbulbifer flavimaris]
MRVPRVYSHEPLAGRSEVELDESASRHLVKVLRLQAGRPLVIFDGRGGEYSGELAATGKRATVRLGDFSGEDRESPLALTLAIGISRGDRFDWVIQKATELGVARVLPLFTERCEVKLTGERLQKKLGHWRQIAISACEQCARNRVPEIAGPQKFAQFLQGDGEAGLKLVLHHRTDASLRELEREQGRPQSAQLLVGPEGGLSAQEIEAALANGYAALRLGPRVLRTETAPVAALSVLQYQWGDL